AAAHLDHPGIVPVYEVGEHAGQHFFSMGFVEGRSLAKKLADGPLPPREAAELLRKAAEAIAYAHQRGVTASKSKSWNNRRTPAMNRRPVLRSLLVWLGAVAAVGLSARPAHAYYFFFQYP